MNKKDLFPNRYFLYEKEYREYNTTFFKRNYWRTKYIN